MDQPAREHSWLRTIRDSLRGEHHDYTEGSLVRALVLLAIPMVLEMAMESVFAVVDAFFVGNMQHGAREALATVGLTESLLTLLYALAIGLSMATTAMVARRVGEKDLTAAAIAGGQAIWVALGLGVAIGIPGAVYAQDLLWLMGAEPDVIAAGWGYTAVLLGGNVVIFLLFLDNAIFRGAGDASVALRSLVLANGLNCVLDPCLIYGLGPFPELGITGAAIATLCGRGTGVLYQLWALQRGASRVRIGRPALRLHLATVKGLLRLSLGSIGQFLIATASWVGLMRIVAFAGDSALAGYSLAIRVVMFALLPSWGLCNAVATLVGQSLGARKPERAERAVWLTGFTNMTVLGLVTVVFVALPRPILSLFNDDPAVLAIGVQALRTLSYGYVFYAWGMTLTQAFNGAGDTMTPTWINLGCYWLTQLPLAWVLAREAELGPGGVFWAVVGADALFTVVAIVVFRRGQWKTRVV